MSYFGEGNTVAVPLNMIPTPKTLSKIFCCKKEKKKEGAKKDEAKLASNRYFG